MCRVGKRNALVGQFDAVSFTSGGQRDRSFHAIGTIALRTSVIVDHGLLSQCELEEAVVTGSHEYHVLQGAAAFGVASCCCDDIVAYRE